MFLAGRLFAYLIVGLITGWAGMILLEPTGGSMVLFGVIYLLLAGLLIAYGFHRFREVCLGKVDNALKKRYLFRWPFLVPVVGGFVTGLNLCPPFLLAIAAAMEGDSIGGAVLFFGYFFVGTSVYFIPLPFVGFFRRQQALRAIGKFAAMLAGVFYLYKGILMLITAI
jgi:sulfite exporter TauE/SafE